MRRVPVLLSLIGLLAACGGDEGSTRDVALEAGDDAGGAGDSAVDGSGGDASGDTAGDGSGAALAPPDNLDCDPLVPRACALPWPSNLYLADDPSRVTGTTLTFGPTSLPKNFRDVHIDPAPYRRMDGYGVDTSIVVHFAHVDVSGMPTDVDVERSLADDAQILLFAVADGALVREPYWVELDDWESDPSLKVLYVRPGRILQEATRYVVAFRDLADTTGQAIEASPHFAALRDGLAAEFDWLAPRADRFDEVFALLETAGVERASLTLAWDFVTASSEAMHGRMLEVRREGLAAAGSTGPTLDVETVERFTPEEHPDWALRLAGTFEVPSFMRDEVVEDRSGTVVGSVLNEVTDDGGLVGQNGTRRARFWVAVPHSAVGGAPHRIVQYGHGFFGAGSEAVADGGVNGPIANAHHYIFVSCDWTGMSELDYGNIQFMVFDFNHFRWLSDRLHQGFLEFMLLTRAARHDLPTLEPLTELGVTVDTSEILFDGISQGGINGAAFMALTPDIRRGFLAVPGATFSVLAHRSTNFGQFFVALAGAYPGRAEQAVLMQVAQTLWDSTDPGSYYRHISEDPFEDDAPRRVLLAPARGDRSVAPVTLETIARSDAGIAVMTPYDAVRSIPLVEERAYPHQGSALVLFAFENGWAPAAVNRPAPSGPTDVHGATRRLPAHTALMAHFFDTGEVIDTCGGDGCTPE